MTKAKAGRSRREIGPIDPRSRRILAARLHGRLNTYEN